MNRELLRPRWIAGHLLAVFMTALFVTLGFWQLSRNQEKRDETRAREAAFVAPAPPLGRTSPASGTRVEARGTYDPDGGVVLRDRMRGERIGADVLTPLRLADGTAILVDRGWVATPAVAATRAAAPPTGPVVVRGPFRGSRPLRAGDTVRRVDGLLTVPRVDTERLGRDLPYALRPGWIEAQAQAPAPASGVPALPRPEPPDQVNHLHYAIQWFAFALIPVIGWPIVLMRTRKRPRTAR
ncbi:MAG: SURF1 family protein [Actinomycetota bacterium]